MELFSEIHTHLEGAEEVPMTIAEQHATAQQSQKVVEKLLGQSIRSRVMSVAILASIRGAVQSLNLHTEKALENSKRRPSMSMRDNPPTPHILSPASPMQSLETASLQKECDENDLVTQSRVFATTKAHVCNHHLCRKSTNCFGDFRRTSAVSSPRSKM